MSRIATKPSAACDVLALGNEAAEQAALRRRRQGSPPRTTPTAARRRSCADLAVEEPRRVVVAVAAPRPVDEHAIGRADFVRQRRRESSSESARSRALRSFFTRAAPCPPPPSPCRDAASTGRRGRAEPGTLDHRERALEGSLVLAREPDDDVGGEVEVGERLELREVLRRRVASPHRAQDAVVSRLQRDVEMARRRSRLAQRRDEVVAEVVHLDRREAQALDPGQRARLADESRQRVPRLAIAEAAEVDARKHDLAMALRDAALDLREHRAGAPAARASRGRAG